ncbi:tubulin polyglutamylase complex subunit 2-like isoform X2 [Babylonia areolata]|uniref:tubulin polyglutamylase complex subunit 2-like isoform X2 n=1 Tax=Babylonia areolata TaxID=304850 RepID=UPI003FD3D290
MSNESEFAKAKAMVEQLHMGVIKHLERKPGIFKIDQVEKRPVERPVIIAWEQRNTTLLPDDLKNFFMTSNGFHLSWSVKMENGPVPVGRLHINGIGQLTRLNPPTETVSHIAPSLNDLDMDSDDESDGPGKPKFSGGFRIFELDNCDNYGRVCLVYREPKEGSGEMKSEVWFLDRALGWHYLTATFTDYFRLMVMHLGLPYWQYTFTDIGLPPQAKQWFHMYAPTRLEIDISTPHDVQGISSTGVGSRVTFDPAKVLKGKSDKKKGSGASSSNPSPNPNSSSQNRSTKKPPVSSARSAGSSGSKPLSSSSSSQSLVKSSR